VPDSHTDAIEPERGQRRQHMVPDERRIGRRVDDKDSRHARQAIVFE
jgi:hypothetical protein